MNCNKSKLKKLAKKYYLSPDVVTHVVHEVVTSLQLYYDVEDILLSEETTPISLGEKYLVVTIVVTNKVDVRDACQLVKKLLRKVTVNPLHNFMITVK